MTELGFEPGAAGREAQTLPLQPPPPKKCLIYFNLDCCLQRNGDDLRLLLATDPGQARSAHVAQSPQQESGQEMPPGDQVEEVEAVGDPDGRQHDQAEQEKRPVIQIFLFKTVSGKTSRSSTSR